MFLLNLFKWNMDEEELSELMMSLMTTETSTYENNLKLLGYANFDEAKWN